MLKWVCIAPHYLPGYFVEAYYSMFPVVFKLQGISCQIYVNMNSEAKYSVYIQGNADWFMIELSLFAFHYKKYRKVPESWSKIRQVFLRLCHFLAHEGIFKYRNRNLDKNAIILVVDLVLYVQY